MSDFTEALNAAGVKPRHISRLMGVSRVTASNWVRGVTQPHSLVEAKARAMQVAISLALEDGKLPVSDKLPPDERSVRTVSTVKKYMDRIKTLDADPETN